MTIRLVIDCYEFSNTESMQIEIRRPGEIRVSGYDVEASSSWEELSGEYSNCLGIIKLWHDNPLAFLITYAPSSTETDLSIGASFAEHAWEHSALDAPDCVVTALENCKKLDAKKWNDMVYLLDKIGIGIEHKTRSDSAASWAVSSTISMIEGWKKTIRSRGCLADYIRLVASLARSAAAFGARRDYRESAKEVEGDIGEMASQQELSWQVDHFIASLEQHQRSVSKSL